MCVQFNNQYDEENAEPKEQRKKRRHLTTEHNNTLVGISLLFSLYCYSLFNKVMLLTT